MAFALLLTTALALGGFLVTSAQGFFVATGIGSGSAIARALVTRHVGWAIPTVLLSLFSQSMVIFYFIGTGKLVKDEIADLPEAERSRQPHRGRGAGASPRRESRALPGATGKGRGARLRGRRPASG